MFNDGNADGSVLNVHEARILLAVIRLLEAGADARHAQGDNIAPFFSPDDTLLFDTTSGERLDALVAA